MLISSNTPTKMPSEEFERHIKAKMDSHEHPPRPQVWEGIQAQLAKRRRSGIWIWWLTGGASALFLVIGLFTFNYFHQSGPKQTTLTQASNPYTNTSEFPISIEEKCPEEVPVGETIVSTQRPKRPTFNSTSLNLQISPFENNTNFDKEILGSTQLSKINPRKRIPSFTRKVLSIEMHPIAGQEWVLESDIHEILPTPQLLSIKFRPRLWVDISTTAEIAGTRIPKEPEELGNFFRALPYGPDFADIQGWDFVNPISPIGEISPVIKVTYPRIMQSVSASVAYQFRPRWSVDAGVRF
ncbi:MAG: hypothetical protein MRZ79_10290, partial [Bacteroidia bacterium]|nr:hypothetical protein [Bacteroidia bacterium]